MEGLREGLGFLEVLPAEEDCRRLTGKGVAGGEDMLQRDLCEVLLEDVAQVKEVNYVEVVVCGDV